MSPVNVILLSLCAVFALYLAALWRNERIDHTSDVILARTLTGDDNTTVIPAKLVQQMRAYDNNKRYKGKRRNPDNSSHQGTHTR